MSEQQLKPLPSRIMDLPQLATLLGGRLTETLSIGADELFSRNDRLVGISESVLMAFRHADLRRLGSSNIVANVPQAVAVKLSFDPVGLDPDDPTFASYKRLGPSSIFTATPENHAVLKPVFTRSLSVDQMEPFSATVRRTADALVERYAGDEIDLPTQWGQGLAFGIWAEMLGMTEDDRARIHQLVADMAPIFQPGEYDRPAIELMAQATPAYARMLVPILARARASGAAPFLSRMSELYAAITEPTAAMPESCEMMAAMSMFDAFEALGGSVAACAYAMTVYPDAFDALRRDPTLVPQAVAESLRLFAPVRMVARYAVEAFDYDGLNVPQGSLLLMNFGAGGRDPEAYDNPLEFDLHRPNRPTTAFGAGRQACPGQHLARAVCAGALDALLRARITLRPTGSAEWSSGPGPLTMATKLVRFPVALDRAPA